MILSFFFFMFFIILAGIAIGSLIAIKVWYSFPFFPIIIGVTCFFSLWIGVMLGATFFSWLPLFFIRILIVAYCIGLVLYFYRQYHPSYGYIPYRGFAHWWLLSLFFFLIGLDFAIIGLSAWLLFLLMPIFGAAIFLGTLIVWKFRVSRTIGGFIIYLPLLFFMFLALVKLL